MKTSEFLAELASIGASIHSDGLNLRIDAPCGVVGPELLAQARELKDELLEVLPSTLLATSSNTPPSFWDLVASTKPAHERYLNHILSCASCHTATNSLCGEGRRLRNSYEEHLQ